MLVCGWILNELVKPFLVKLSCSKIEISREILLIKGKDRLTALKEIYKTVLDLDSIYERLNPSYAEIPDMLKKLEELNMYIKSGSELHNLLNNLYNSYYIVNYNLRILEKNKDNDKMQPIKDMTITVIHNIPSISSKIKTKLKKELN